jgi:hypothetical protein
MGIENGVSYGMVRFVFRSLTGVPMKFRVLTVAVSLLAGLLMGGCSTLTSAYDKTVDTVSGWVK